MLDKLVECEDVLLQITGPPVEIINMDNNHGALIKIRENLAALLPEVRILYCYYKQVRFSELHYVADLLKVKNVILGLQKRYHIEG